MTTDYQRALICQQQYNNQLTIRTVAGVTYSRVDTPGRIQIIKRGTSNLFDAQRDIEAVMTECPFGRVHSGAWNGVPDVLDAENIPNDDTTIEVIGHSLGAMRAQLAYRELKRRGYKNLCCVSFECPRFGDIAAINYGNNPDTNITYQNYKNLFEHDAFTMIPLHLPLEPYEAVPNCKQFWSAPTADNEWKEAPLNIQAHSLKDCVIPGLKVLCGA